MPSPGRNGVWHHPSPPLSSFYAVYQPRRKSVVAFASVEVRSRRAVGLDTWAKTQRGRLVSRVLLWSCFAIIPHM
jgi:hypothetical protein